MLREAKHVIVLNPQQIGGGGGGGGGPVSIVNGGVGSAIVMASNPTGAEQALVVRPIYDGSILNVNVVGAVAGFPTPTYNVVTLVPANVSTTVSTYVVPALMTFYCAGFIASGDINALFILTINGLPVIAGRSTVAQQTVQPSFLGANPTALAGQVVTVAVTHYAAGLLGNFEGTIIGTLQ